MKEGNMCGPYWSQFSHGELMSMQGVEIDDEDHDTDLDHDEDDTDLDQEPGYCCARSPCGNCMDCLGMSNRDFM
jgi:hypothetical protein